MIGEVEEIKVKDQKRKVIPAKLTYIPEQCTYCQIENTSIKEIKSQNNYMNMYCPYYEFLKGVFLHVEITIDSISLNT